jgi:hypothetical protein
VPGALGQLGALWSVGATGALWSVGATGGAPNPPPSTPAPVHSFD